MECLQPSQGGSEHVPGGTRGGGSAELVSVVVEHRGAVSVEASRNLCGGGELVGSLGGGGFAEVFATVTDQASELVVDIGEVFAAKLCVAQIARPQTTPGCDAPGLSNVP